MIYKSFAEFANSQAINIREATDPSIMREAAIVVAGAIKQRIENQGKASDGRQMRTKSKEAYGAYSAAWGEKRAKKGRQTSIIDLNYTGEMWRSWLPIPVENGWAATFVKAEAMKKAFSNQRLFGEIFSPSVRENKIALQAMLVRFRKIMARKSR